MSNEQKEYMIDRVLSMTSRTTVIRFVTVVMKPRILARDHG